MDLHRPRPRPGPRRPVAGRIVDASDAHAAFSVTVASGAVAALAALIGLGHLAPLELTVAAATDCLDG